MSEAEFRTRRRQKFLTEKYYKLNRTSLAGLLAAMKEGLNRETAEGVIDSQFQDGIFKNRLQLLTLQYTAGEPIESLIPLYADVAQWFAELHRAHEMYRADLSREGPDPIEIELTPLHFEALFHFQLALDVVSLGLLLGQAKLLRQSIFWLRSMRHTDMLLETIIEPAVADPSQVERFFHEKPYGALVDAVYTATTTERSEAFVKQYLDGWYAAFEGVPWHNGHLAVSDERSAYEGYWAYEAAAVCVIHGIDDRSFRDHLVYPKDLADWAREHRVLDSIKASAQEAPPSLRREGGQACPQSGTWYTPAQGNRRTRFEAGQTMPVIADSPWGATIWYRETKAD
jgi:Domain of unknown function (DUF1911)